jgi:hypothetical protein
MDLYSTWYKIKSLDMSPLSATEVHTITIINMLVMVPCGGEGGSDTELYSPAIFFGNSKLGPVDGPCEHINEPSGSIKCWVILEWLNDWQLLKKDPDPWS